MIIADRVELIIDGYVFTKNVIKYRLLIITVQTSNIQ